MEAETRRTNLPASRPRRWVVPVILVVLALGGYGLYRWRASGDAPPPDVLARLLPRFIERYPKVELEVQVENRFVNIKDAHEPSPR